MNTLSILHQISPFEMHILKFSSGLRPLMFCMYRICWIKNKQTNKQTNKQIDMETNLYSHSFSTIFSTLLKHIAYNMKTCSFAFQESNQCYSFTDISVNYISWTVFTLRISNLIFRDGRIIHVNSFLSFVGLRHYNLPEACSPTNRLFSKPMYPKCFNNWDIAEWIVYIMV